MYGSERLADNRGLSQIPNIQSPIQSLALLPAVQALGVDLVHIQRMQDIYDRWGERILVRIFTDQERHSCQNANGYRWRSLAGRFGAKEAVKKILASQGQLVGLNEIEILNGTYGEPYIRLHGRAQAAFERLGYTHLMLSISHDAGMAIATVIAS